MTSTKHLQLLRRLGWCLWRATTKVHERLGLKLWGAIRSPNLNGANFCILGRAAPGTKSRRQPGFVRQPSRAWLKPNIPLEFYLRTATELSKIIYERHIGIFKRQGRGMLWHKTVWANSTMRAAE